MEKVIEDVLYALQEAYALHPEYPVDIIHAAAILSEESGEVVKASNEHVYEGKEKSHVYSEALQVAASAIRFLIHFDELEGRRSWVVKPQEKV